MNPQFQAMNAALTATYNAMKNNNTADDEFKDRDAWEPSGSDPVLRRDRSGILYYNYNGSWYNVSHNLNLPAVVRAAWLQEEMNRDRKEKGNECRY